MIPSKRELIGWFHHWRDSRYKLHAVSVTWIADSDCYAWSLFAVKGELTLNAGPINISIETR